MTQAQPNRQQMGLALPTVATLAMLCSILLMAEWRHLSLAEGLGQSAHLRWRLQLATHAALLTAVRDIQFPADDQRHQPGNNTSTHVFFPVDHDQWNTLQNRLSSQTCSSGICKPLGNDSQSLQPWLSRLSQAQNATTNEFVSVVYWVEIVPLQTTLVSTTSPFVYRITALAQESSHNAVFASQALWQPTLSHPASMAQPMQLAGFKRLLSLSP